MQNRTAQNTAKITPSFCFMLSCPHRRPSCFLYCMRPGQYKMPPALRASGIGAYFRKCSSRRPSRPVRRGAALGDDNGHRGGSGLFRLCWLFFRLCGSCGLRFRLCRCGRLFRSLDGLGLRRLSDRSRCRRFVAGRPVVAEKVVHPHLAVHQRLAGGGA